MGQIEAPVEAVLEFGEIAEHVTRAHRFQRACDCRLEIAQHRVDPLEAGELLAVVRGLRDVDRLMLATGPRHRAKAAEPVGDHARCRRQMRSCHGLDVVAVVGLHDVQQQAQRVAVIAGCDGHDERGLVGPAPALFSAVQKAFFAAQHRVVHLDAAIELARSFALDHHRHELVAHQRGRIGPDAELPGQFERRDRVFRLSE